MPGRFVVATEAGAEDTVGLTKVVWQGAVAEKTAMENPTRTALRMLIRCRCNLGLPNAGSQFVQLLMQIADKR
ncbi:MAG: hypothetical protein NVS1B11_15090 [Terriglobales bacterium]